MGYNTSATTTTLIARLTPYGRQRLLVNDINIITKFGLGDSDANYYTNSILPTGKIPNIGGSLGGNSTNTNSSSNSSMIRNNIRFLPTGIIYKPIESTSYMVTTNNVKLGSKTVSSSGLTQEIIDRNITTGSNAYYSNLFRTFGLPITDTEKKYFSNINDINGGYSNTALSGLNQDKILVIGINQNEYGEMLDGKSVKISIQFSGGTYDIYGTYQKGISSPEKQDNNIKEIANTNIRNIGDPLTMLFSDDIKRPNGDPTKSWGTGFDKVKPFSVANKMMFNNKTSNVTSQSADTVVGVSYLDKGFIVITHPDIVNSFDLSGTSATTVTFNSIATDVAQNITCIKDRNEFGVSTNPTYSNGDVIRMSELGLYDDNNRLIALAKPDKQIEIPTQTFIALSVKITV